MKVETAYINTDEDRVIDDIKASDSYLSITFAANNLERINFLTKAFEAARIHTTFGYASYGRHTLTVPVENSCQALVITGESASASDKEFLKEVEHVLFGPA